MVFLDKDPQPRLFAQSEDWRAARQRSRPPIQPAPGEYAIAALERAKQCLARTGFVAVLAARADDLELP
jgi:hypothetical protein